MNMFFIDSLFAADNCDFFDNVASRITVVYQSMGGGKKVSKIASIAHISGPTLILVG